MVKTFRSWDVDEPWLLPPSIHDFVPAGHRVHLFRDVVRDPEIPVDEVAWRLHVLAATPYRHLPGGRSDVIEGGAGG